MYIEHLNPIEPDTSAMSNPEFDPTQEIPSRVTIEECEFELTGSGSISVSVEQEYVPTVRINEYDGYELPSAIWTTVWEVRERGIPGTWKERVRLPDDRRYRLGGLYRHADFALRERESNYRKYGERPEYNLEDDR